MAAGSDYDVLILDRMLPGLDGLAIVRTLRASGNHTPVLFLSALGDVDQLTDAERDVLSQCPFGPDRHAARDPVEPRVLR